MNTNNNSEIIKNTKEKEEKRREFIDELYKLEVSISSLLIEKSIIKILKSCVDFKKIKSNLFNINTPDLFGRFTFRSPVEVSSLIRKYFQIYENIKLEEEIFFEKSFKYTMSNPWISESNKIIIYDYFAEKIEFYKSHNKIDYQLINTIVSMTTLPIIKNETDSFYKRPWQIKENEIPAFIENITKFSSSLKFDNISFDKQINKEYKSIILTGNADLIIDNTLITYWSSWEPVINIESILYSLICVILYKEEIKSIGVFNPQANNYFVFSLNDILEYEIEEIRFLFYKKLKKLYYL